jgi:glycerophosphoryl diester phosphodiesterase
MRPPRAVPLPEAFLRMPIAHRGFHDRAAGRIENSPAAFRAAIEAGYAIECDIQPASDGTPMVFHDYDLRRLTGQPGRIAGQTPEALGRTTLTDGTDKIPTLRAVLDLVAGRVPLLIEIKDQDGAMGPDVGALEHAVAAAVKSYGGPVAFMSFNPHSVAALAQAAPERPRGLTTSAYRAEDWPLIPAATRDRLRGIPDYDAVGASFISHEASDLDRPRVADLKGAGAAILTWTIRSPEADAAARRIAENVTFEGYRAAATA